jgi:mono/diheme cytochrome c family protein
MKTLFMIIVSILLFSCAVRRSEPVKQRTFTPATADIAHGEQVYMSWCHKCHPSGESGLAPSINSSPAPGFLKKFQVRHGLGVMPSFKANEISKNDLRDVVKFIKAWKRY